MLVNPMPEPISGKILDGLLGMTQARNDGSSPDQIGLAPQKMSLAGSIQLQWLTSLQSFWENDALLNSIKTAPVNRESLNQS